VVKADAERTRIGPKKLQLEQLLTYYSKKNQIKYKQGINEVNSILFLSER